MAYVEGYVAAVPVANKERYIEMAVQVAAALKASGALRTVETWEHDVPDGKLTSFPMAVKREAGEAIIFSWIEWPSKAVRDDGWKTVMQDPAMQGANDLFDGKRMIFGGFDIILDK